MSLYCLDQSDELGLQKKLRTEVIQLEDTLAQVRKEYEMLRIEFEQNLAANEQAGTCWEWVEVSLEGCGSLPAAYPDPITRAFLRASVPTENRHCTNCVIQCPEQPWW